jgi:putative flippase GtrA
MSLDVSRAEAASRGRAHLALLALRWARWGTVGTLGLGVQAVTLLALARVPGLHYLAATFMAVSGAIVHNFIWHERWTWGDQPSLDLVHRLARLGRFTAVTGLMSIVGNVGLTAAYVERFGLPLLRANLLAVATISLVNFLAAHRFVFFAQGIVGDVGDPR